MERNFITKFGKNRVSGNGISPWLLRNLGWGWGKQAWKCQGCGKWHWPNSKKAHK